MENRREFLRAGVQATAGLAATGFIPRRTAAQNATGTVRYRDLGSTGFKVSEIGFGAMNMRSAELVHAAIDSGINYIDTAYVYQRGANEQVIGEVMETRRDEVWLTTKTMTEDPAEVPVQMRTSLERLKTDHVDLNLVHAVADPQVVLNEDLMKAFEDAKNNGLTRFVGISTHTNQAAVVDAVVESKFWDAVLVGYNYFVDPSVKESIAKARAAGIAIIAMKNILNPATNPWTPLADIREGDGGGMTAQQALIKWVLEDPNVDTTIPGITSFEQLADDVALMNMRMGFEDRETLRRYAANVGNHYCRGLTGCTGCQNQCPHGVQVNDILRCMGYANGYGDPAMAWEQYRSLPQPSRLAACGDCDECTVTCVNGLDLTRMMKQAKEMFA